jgi:hypothetical protein
MEGEGEKERRGRKEERGAIKRRRRRKKEKKEKEDCWDPSKAHPSDLLPPAGPHLPKYPPSLNIAPLAGDQASNT